MIENIFTPTEFDTIADILLNKTILRVQESDFRICEIEFYYRNAQHDDAYVHGNADQSTFGNFYFHKFANGSYVGGTYKGVDLTFGSPETYCGVLIRSIMDVASGKIIEGPCRCVDKILQLNDSTTVGEFAQDKEMPFNIYYNDYELYIEDYDAFPRETIWAGPRIGLSNKYPEFRDRPYRYLIFRGKVKKQTQRLNEVK